MADAQKIITLENLIKGYLADLGELREKLKAQKEMMRDVITQDKAYSTAASETKILKKKEAEIKEKLVKLDAVVAAKTKIEELQGELKQINQSLSDYLNQYAMLTNSTEFIGPDGDLHQIIRSAKLVKKRV